MHSCKHISTNINTYSHITISFTITTTTITHTINFQIFSTPSTKFEFCQSSSKHHLLISLSFLPSWRDCFHLFCELRAFIFWKSLKEVTSNLFLWNEIYTLIKFLTSIIPLVTCEIFSLQTTLSPEMMVAH